MIQYQTNTVITNKERKAVYQDPLFLLLDDEDEEHTAHDHFIIIPTDILNYKMFYNFPALMAQE